MFTETQDGISPFFYVRPRNALTRVIDGLLKNTVEVKDSVFFSLDGLLFGNFNYVVIEPDSEVVLLKVDATLCSCGRTTLKVSGPLATGFPRYTKYLLKDVSDALKKYQSDNEIPPPSTYWLDAANDDARFVASIWEDISEVSDSLGGLEEVLQNPEPIPFGSRGSLAWNLATRESAFRLAPITNIQGLDMLPGETPDHLQSLSSWLSKESMVPLRPKISWSIC